MRCRWITHHRLFCFTLTHQRLTTFNPRHSMKLEFKILRSMSNWARATGASIRALRRRTRFLCGLWVIFFILVALGIHGSSTGVTAEWWAAERPYEGYLFDIPAAIKEEASRIDPSVVQSLLMRN